MTKVSIIICDFCKADGYLRKAVVSYTGENNQEFHACKKHLKNVKEAGYKVFYIGQDLEVSCLRI